MLKSDWNMIESMSKNLKLTIPHEQDLDQCDMTVFLESKKTPNLKKVCTYDIIGGITVNTVKVGDCYTNPYNKYTHLRVVEVDHKSDRVLVRLVHNK